VYFVLTNNDFDVPPFSSKNKILEELGVSEFFSRPDKSSIHFVDCRISSNFQLFNCNPTRGHEFINI